MDCDPKLPRLQSLYFNENEYLWCNYFENKNDKEVSFIYFSF